MGQTPGKIGSLLPNVPTCALFIIGSDRLFATKSSRPSYSRCAIVKPWQTCAAMDTTRPFIHAIQAAYPNFVVEEAVFLEDGQYNDVLLVNGRTIFRFPRYPGGLEQLALETKILTAVQPYLPLPVPHPTFVHFANPVA